MSPWWTADAWLYMGVGTAPSPTSFVPSRYSFKVFTLTFVIHVERGLPLEFRCGLKDFVAFDGRLGQGRHVVLG